MESPAYGTPNLWDIFRSFFVQKVSHKLAHDCILRCQCYFTSKCHSVATVHISDHFREFYKSRSHGLKREAKKSVETVKSKG